MPALNFKNNTGQSKFTGTINYQGFNYDYIIYLTPLINPIEKQEIEDLYMSSGIKELLLNFL